MFFKKIDVKRHYAMKKTLVTGASGFTGKVLCRRLVQRGDQVVAFARPTSNIEELQSLGVEIRRTDIKDPENILDNFSDIRKVYHLAAAWRVEHSSVEEFRAVNVKATRNLLEAAKKRNVQRFIHCSTVGVHGHIDDPPADENYRFNPGDHYQQTKLEGELLVQEYLLNGLPGVIVRPAGIYGPGDIRFLKLFKPISKGLFVMIGSGNVFYHFTYVEDLVQGFLLAGENPDVLGEVFTIAGDEYITLRELTNVIADILDKPHPVLRVPFYPVYLAAVLCDKICKPFGIQPPLFPRRVEFFSKDRAFTNRKAKKLLKFKPQVSLREGLQKTADWYHKEGLIG
jgi:nucleoside-diphosphate-sugar epimerase